MDEWYCVVKGTRYGPVNPEELRTWVAQGRLGPDDLVWKSGMSDWTRVATLPELLSAAAAAPLVSMTGVAAPSGTAGRTPNRELMREARARLRGTWGAAVGLLLLFGLLVLAGAVVFCLGWVALILGLGPMQLGMTTFFLAIARSGRHETGMLFRGFKVFGTSLGAFWLIFLLLLAWSLLGLPGNIADHLLRVNGHPLLGVIIGILFGAIPANVASYLARLRYSMTYFLIADNPGLGPLDAIRRSKRMMFGCKWKLFCLWLRFIGWGLLCVAPLLIGFGTLGATAGGGHPAGVPLALGIVLTVLGGVAFVIGGLFLSAYLQVSIARFYDDLGAPAAQAQAAAPTAPATPASPQVS